KILSNWYYILIIAILIIEALTFIIAGEAHTYIGVHDNLDIHIADYKLLKDNNAFFSHNITLPLLGGIDRNFLLSEFYLYAVLYMIFPNFAAYIIGYFLKIFIALFSGILLGKDLLKESYKKYEWIVVLFSFIYGLLPLYPAFSFAFASLPLLVWLIRKVLSENKPIYYILLFLYPTLSYFTFFGPFIIGYLFIFFLWKTFKEKRFCIPVFISMILISLGYILIEYRLFLLIFTSGEATIRDTMQEDNLSIAGIISTSLEVFKNSIFHSEDLHRVVVLPLVLVALIVINGLYIYKKQYKKILSDPFNLIFLFICFNCIIYGLYHSESVRTLFETLVPPLKGWQYNRTVFFNPLLWYIEAAIIVKRLFDHTKKYIAVIVTIIILLSVMGTQSLYNDFYNTVYVNAWQTIKNEKSETLSYGEFYSTSLFESIKEDINYDGEYSVAYGFHPAVLSYNEISTLDGCLSYYYQSYKESFRNIIAPALETSEVARDYYDNWGARAYIFSGTVDSIWSPERTKEVDDHNLMIDIDAFKELGGVYIFSRIEIDNATDLGLTLEGTYTDNESPYTIYLYSAKE
ncbi:MAG: YfhO family protein, partial [Butyrivibrio sp.]|nr:YfhO family protein [Butyrivibrio sp.]